MADHKKEVIVEKLKEQLGSAKGAVFTTYSGLTVAQDTELRRELRSAGVTYHVVKNTMLRRAADALGLEGLDPHLEGTTAFAFSAEDAVAPAKVICDYIKKNKLDDKGVLSVKVGTVEGKVIEANEVQALASLPSREELIAKLRKNQLLRMLRVDKVIISLLAESMKAYLNKEFELITTQKLLHKSVKELEILANFINKNLKTLLEIVRTQTFVGGGAMPNKKIPSVALAVSGDAVLNEQKFRQKKVIGRIENDKFLLDLRTLLDEDVNELIKIINETEEK